MMYSIHHPQMLVMGCVVSQENKSKTAPFAKPAKSAAPGKERAHPCKNHKNGPPA
jgi:hypothetical protein